ncbi:hypothetical protein CY34DRAFT_91594 [Suillus luteus UH-Slu-Lm8-n1]|uniref:Uncharacterized protein n=1 Tax=Suillus luteus UH-Slu-Lm8-n1 TaxID=930992 RepID=A0A0D0B2B1_9AGAM|nr:hypothetical protein CY34DRAFT_91594 [Suillus luteus UH-Slu-Lm8-n1]
MGLHPTMLETMSKSHNKWLRTYTVIFTHSTSCTGSLAFSSTDIWYRLDHIMITLLAELAGLGPAFRDTYFGHELTGMKGATIYNGEDEDE